MNTQIASIDPTTMQKVCAPADKPILVIGDLMLDSYIEGTVSRISPEAPVPVLNNPSEEKFAIGGAGNVAHNLVTLKNSVRLIGGLGTLSEGEYDNSAKTLISLLSSVGIASDFLCTLDRKTILKQRILAGKQQILRIDTEDSRPLSDREERLIIGTFHKANSGVGAIVVSDFAKGIFSKNLGEEIGRYAKENKIPLVADVKLESLNNLSNPTLLTLNLAEAIKFSGEAFSGNTEDIANIALKLHKQFSCQIVITCGNLGMIIYDGNQTKHILTQEKEVYDISGAGDSVTAAFAHGLVRNMSLEHSANLATLVASIAVSHRGATAVRLDEVEYQANKMIVPKTWGHEEWIVNSDYCGKKLVLKEGHCCSLHFHKIKDETFYIASGKVGFQLNDQFFILRPGDSLLITPGTKHRFYGISHSEIFEFSTHHMEEDSYRDEVSGTFEISLFEGIPNYSTAIR